MRANSRDPDLRVMIRVLAMEYPWQEFVLAAFGAAPESLEAKIAAAERAIAVLRELRASRTSQGKPALRTNLRYKQTRCRAKVPGATYKPKTEAKRCWAEVPGVQI